MKRITLLFGALFGLPFLLISQNLLLNGSFENNPHCSESVDSLPGWVDLSGSPIILSKCNIQNAFRVPQSWWGNEQPYQGDAYLMMSFGNLGQNDFVGQKLPMPLMPGMQYDISYAISHADTVGVCTREVNITMGVDTFPITSGAGQFGSGPINRRTVGPFNSIQIRDGWTLFNIKYMPDSAYQFVMIGNGFENHLTTFDTCYPPNIPYLPQAKYFIDNVSIEMTGWMPATDPTTGKPRLANSLGYFDLTGRKIREPVKGQICVERFSDGSGRKILLIE